MFAVNWPRRKAGSCMKRPVDLGRRFLTLADRDIKTFHLLAAIPDSDDQAVGFHAQQSIEKCIKAVLSVSEIYKIVPIENATLAPMALDLLCFIAGCAQVIDNFEDGFCNPFRRDFTAVVKLNGE